MLQRLRIAAFSAALIACASGASDKSKEGMVTRQDLEIVDCLLPGQVRSIGGTTYITARRPIRTNASDCHIRGGEYTAYDRADYKSALHVWMDLASSGDPEAMTNVAEIYERGLGGEPNYAAAIIWYQKIIDAKGIPEQKKSRALFNLGTLYEQGQGVEKDQLKALNLYRRAWGVPEDNLIYTSAKDREVGALRTELEEAISKDAEQIEKLQETINELRKKSSADASTMQEILAKLQAERAANVQRLSAMPPVSVATRKPEASDAAPAPITLGPAVKVASADFGRYYGLIIGNQNYDVLESLKTPRSDAERVAKILTDKYGFTVQVLEDANDVAILKALNDLNGVLGPNDNLLIYYAGHGFRLTSAQFENGYWLPRNAERPPNDTFWVPNEQVTSHIGRIQAKRVLVVADSCYAGLLSSDPSLFFLDKPTEVSADYINFKLPKRSRLLIASGGDNPVLDEGGQGNSVFARAFLDVLENNNGIMTAPGLYSMVEAKVKEGAMRNHFSQQPEFKSIKGAGHEVGDFFFVPLARAKS